jgi:hypothetical protein
MDSEHDRERHLPLIKRPWRKDPDIAALEKLARAANVVFDGLPVTYLEPLQEWDDIDDFDAAVFRCGLKCFVRVDPETVAFLLTAEGQPDSPREFEVSQRCVVGGVRMDPGFWENLRGKPREILNEVMKLCARRVPGFDAERAVVELNFEPEPERTKMGWMMLHELAGGMSRQDRLKLGADILSEFPELGGEEFLANLEEPGRSVVRRLLRRKGRTDG